MVSYICCLPGSSCEVETLPAHVPISLLFTLLLERCNPLTLHSTHYSRTISGGKCESCFFLCLVFIWNFITSTDKLKKVPASKLTELVVWLEKKFKDSNEEIWLWEIWLHQCIWRHRGWYIVWKTMDGKGSEQKNWQESGWTLNIKRFVNNLANLFCLYFPF